MSIETTRTSGQDHLLPQGALEHGTVIDMVADDQVERMRARRSFRFHHLLGHDPSMSLPEISKLTERMLDEKRFDQVVCQTGAVEGGDYQDVKERKVVLETLGSLRSRDAWLRLTRVDEVTSQFKSFVDRFYSDLSELYHQEIDSRVLKTFVTLFVSSPRAITPYHMDHTWNFLLQIQGSKTVHLFDPSDTRVLLQQDKEIWYMQKSGVTQKSDAPDIAYDLEPGYGVHHPVNAPHWVQNGPDISVSLSLGLCLHNANHDARVHQFNFFLRRLGLNPLPPGVSKVRDKAKASVISALSDRNPSSFDAVVFSGKTRLSRIMRLLRLDT